MAASDEISGGARRVAERLAGATVTIGRDGRGSGVVVAPGRVLTNSHLLRDATTTVTFESGRDAQGRVLGLDADGDLAVLDVDTGDAPAAALAPAAPTLGDLVFGVGRGGGTLRVTPGFVAATGAAFRGPRGRRIAGAVEHTAPLARGSSGGALTDAEGRVVGINTHRCAPGFYLARPVDDALRARLDQLLGGATIARRSLGLTLAPAHVARRLRHAVGLPERDGLLVRGVEPDGPAARAGVREGDLVVRAGDVDLAGIDDLHDALDRVGVEGAPAQLALVVVRGVEEVDLAVDFDAGDPATA
jgi:serine protease Do